jgi:hypothetical protein
VKGSPTICAGKDKLTEQAAREIASRARSWKAKPFHCRDCGGWHVGVSNPRRPKVIRRK